MVTISCGLGRVYLGGFHARFVAGRRIKPEIGIVEMKGFDATTDVSVRLQARLGRVRLEGFPPKRIVSDFVLGCERATVEVKGFPATGVFATHSQYLKPERGTVEMVGFPPDIPINILENISWNDDVFLLVLDRHENVQFFRGVVRDIDERDRYVDISAKMGAGLLSERIIEENYPEQDIGQTVKDIILGYCRPLTAENVNTSTGISAPVKAKGNKPIRILENLRRRYNIFYFVDNTWDVHFYLEDEIEEGPYTVALGEHDEEEG